jgi:protein gp37
MSDKSAIEWTEATWNPTTGCDRISPGCDSCYALTLAKRLQAMGNPKYQNDGDPRTSGPGFGLTIHPSALQIPYAWKRPRIVFVNSMSDLFHARVPLDFIRQVFAVMVDTPHHTYQVLTKRPHRLARIADKLEWPSNVWLGVSVENPDQYDRIRNLREVPAAVRFVSCEPLLARLPDLPVGGIDWVIAGGESGFSARPVDPEWIRDIRDQCVAARTPFFFKQWGGIRSKSGGRELDGRTWSEMPKLVVSS